MEDRPASRQIDDMIEKYGGWKSTLLAQLRDVIHQAEPDIVEEVKWKMRTRPEGLSVWSHDGIVCFAEVWKDNIKLLFPNGSRLKDSENIFNARLQSKDIRAIEFKDCTMNVPALITLVHEAVDFNATKLHK